MQSSSTIGRNSLTGSVLGFSKEWRISIVEMRHSFSLDRTFNFTNIIEANKEKINDLDYSKAA